eukprot:CCRYP_016968-RA/>CCRYP_016968-RA protein AED:0.08 eAED:0.08 QI:2777/0/0.5/1/0/0/2/0/74
MLAVSPSHRVLRAPGKRAYDVPLPVPRKDSERNNHVSKQPHQSRVIDFIMIHRPQGQVLANFHQTANWGEQMVG